MPSRLISLIIIFFWLGMGVWLFVRDVWPKIRPGEPPAYTLMASDEAPKQGPPIGWNIFHNGFNAYDMVASTAYQEKTDRPGYDDTFEMWAIVRAKQQRNERAPQRRLRSLIRITRDGKLREINAQLHIAVKDWECVFDVEGPLDEGYLFPRWRFRKFPADGNTEARVFDRLPILDKTHRFELSLPFHPMEFADHGIVFNPLHPPNRLDVLKPNQQFRLPYAGSLLVLESLGVTLHAHSEGERLESVIERGQETLGRALEDVPLLEARVLPTPELLPLRLTEKERKEGPPMCWVIDARDEYTRIHARIWVQESDGDRKGLVLRQETVIASEDGEDVWVVERD
jgi:hypothetical protein